MREKLPESRQIIWVICTSIIIKKNLAMSLKNHLSHGLLVFFFFFKKKKIPVGIGWRQVGGRLEAGGSRLAYLPE